MNIKQALLHNTGWKIFTMLFTFVNNIIMVRLLGVITSASFFYVLAIFSLISTILRFGLENGVVYYASKNEKKIGSLAKFVFFITIIQVVITFFVLKYFVKEAVVFNFFWSVIFVVGNISMYYVTSFYQVKRMYVSINVISTVIAFLQTIVYVGLYFSFITFSFLDGIVNGLQNRLLLILSMGVLLQLIWLCSYFYHSNKNSFLNVELEKDTLKKVFCFSFINFAGSVLLFLVMRADFYFVEKYCDAIALGNYVQISKIGQMALIFPNLLGGVIFPYTVNALDAFADKISFFCRLVTLAFLLLFIFLLITGKYIFVWLLGIDFSLMYAGILGTFIGIYCLAMCMILISYLEGKNKQNIVLIANFVILTLIIIGDVIFVPLYGYLAAAIIFSIANFVGFMILLTYFIKSTRVSIRNVFLFTKHDTAIFKF